jgi:hypothetical protein
MLIVIVCVLLAGAVIAYTLLVRARDIPSLPADDPELKHLEARRQVLYENLKDLQFEYHQGKLSEEDYQSLKQGFLYDLAGVMDSIERRAPSKGIPTGRVDKAGRSPKGKPGGTRSPQATVCPSCQESNPPGNRFCGSCGTALPAPPEGSPPAK